MCVAMVGEEAKQMHSALVHGQHTAKSELAGPSLAAVLHHGIPDTCCQNRKERTTGAEPRGTVFLFVTLRHRRSYRQCSAEHFVINSFIL